MKQLIFLSFLLLINCECEKSKIDNPSITEVKKSSDDIILKYNQDTFRAKLKIETWSCKDFIGGITKINSLDSVELELGSNQVWVLSKFVKKENFYEIYFIKTLNLGRGGMNINWFSFSKDRPIGLFQIIDSSKALKKWYGFFNMQTNTYENEIGFDWDACDTLYLN